MAHLPLIPSGSDGKVAILVDPTGAVFGVQAQR